MPVNNLELLQQVHLSGEVKCKSFAPNSWRPSFCTNCSSLFDKHSAEAIPSDEVLIRALEYSQKSEQTASCVLPAGQGVGGLFLGGFKSVINVQFLQESNIGHIVNTAKGLEIFGPKYTDGVRKAKDDLHVQFLNLNWEDSVSFAIPDYDLATAVNFIHKARTEGSSVLVHCAQGKSRSSTAVIAYIMAVEKCGLKPALIKVQSARKMAEPNPTFMTKLKEFESSSTLTELQSKMQ